MTRRTRPLAKRLAGGDALTGIVVKMPSPALIELAGYSGFDLVVLDTEHGAGDGGELEHHLRAADAAEIPVLVRVGLNDPLLILRALDSGATGVIVPHIDSGEEAKAAVRAAHYPPLGSRGFAVTTRAGRQGTLGEQRHLALASETTLVVAQIESREAVPHTADIANTRGLDAVWFGPGDLSLSLGQPGNHSHPNVLSAVDQIVSAVATSPACGLCVLVADLESATAWRRRGAQIVLFSAHTLIAQQFRAVATGQTQHEDDAEAPPPEHHHEEEVRA